MIIHELRDQMIDHIETLRSEMKTFKDEASIWKVSGEIKNSAGTLCLHLCGNLQHFIGALLGNSGYVRKREEEFGRRNVPLNELLMEVEIALEAVKKTMSGLDDSILETTYPTETFGKDKSIHFVLVTLVAHFNYHLGQINYCRRLQI